MVKNKQGNITMTKEQEDKIIAQAQDIIERRMAVEKDIKVDLQKVVCYGNYYMGALDAARNIIANYVWGTFRGDDKIYRDAELNLIKSSKRNMQLFLDGTRIAYRKHKRHKSGKLESVEAYFVEYKNVITEVK